MLRITVDSERGDGRVPVGALATLSREIETQLDVSVAGQGSSAWADALPSIQKIES